MANYMCATRSNYFKVTDTNRFKELTDKLVSENEILVYCNPQTKECSLACYGAFEFMIASSNEEDEEEIYDNDIFYEALSKIIEPNDAAIFTEVGAEKLRYLVGSCCVITRNHVEYIDLSDIAITTVRGLLDNPVWTTKMDY